MDVNFESVLLSQLILNVDYSSVLFPHIECEWFESESNRLLFNQSKKHILEYNSLPTKESLIVDLDRIQTTEEVYNQSLSTIQNLECDKGIDKMWMIKTAEEWAKDRACHLALAECIGIQADGKKNRLVMPEIMAKAASVDFTTDVGMDYFEDSAKFYDEYYNIGSLRFPFLVKELNRLTNGGTARETLNVVLAGINVGKSTFLIDQACEKTLMGYNCLYISLEMSEDVCKERCDVRMMDMVFGDAAKMSKDEYVSKIHHIKKSCGGKFRIKDFPSGQAGVSKFKNLLRELKIKEGFIPDFIFVDYITLMSSDWLDDRARSNTNTYFGSVATELRGFFKEVNVVGWTACQLVRSKQAADKATLADVGLAIEISAISDFMVFLAQPEELRPQNIGVGSIMKNRLHFLKEQFMLGMDTSRQKFFDYDAGDMSIPTEVQDQYEDMSNMRKEVKDANNSKEPQKPKAAPSMDMFRKKVPQAGGSEKKGLGGIKF